MTIDKIKKALECCINPELNCCNDCPYNNNGRLSCLESEMLKDALNLINELETENERLMKLQARGGCRVAELGIENQQLKDKIAELEDEIERLETVVDIANEREYRKKFTDEWRKEYQKELDKQGNGHIAGHPDFDLVYKLYFEQKDRIAELEKENRQLSKAINSVQKGFDNGEFISKDCQTKTLKQFAERLKDKVKNFCGTEEENHYYDVSKEGACEEIDETLKEYENDTI